LKELNITKTKYQVFRKAFSRYNDVIYSALSQWKSFSNYKTLILQRIFNQLKYRHRNRLNDALQVWRNLNNKVKIRELEKINEEIVTDNSLIAEDIKKLDDKQKVLKDLSQHIKEMKIERCLNLMFRRLQRQGLHRWSRHTNYLEVKETAAKMLYKIETRHLAKNAILKWKKNINEVKRFNYIKNFLENNDKYKNIQLKKKIFNTFQTYYLKQKKAKGNIKRVYIKWNRNISQKYFQRWKTNDHFDKMETIQTKIQKLVDENDQVTTEIHDLNDQIQSTLSYNTHISEKLLTQAKKLLCNTFIRTCNLKIQKSIKIWKETTQLYKRRETRLKGILNNLKRKAQWQGLRKWAIHMLEEKKLETEAKIDSQITENAQIKKIMDQEEEEYNITIKNLKSETAILEKEKEKHKIQYKNAIETLRNRSQNMVKIDRRRLILSTWKNFVGKEKEGISLIFELLQRNTQQNSLQKWREFTFA